VSVSRASHDAQIYTNDATSLAESLSHDVSKTAAVNFTKAMTDSIQHPVSITRQTDSNGLGLSLVNDVGR
jgi:hypothetical protein